MHLVLMHQSSTTITADLGPVFTLQTTKYILHTQESSSILIQKQGTGGDGSFELLKYNLRVEKPFHHEEKVVELIVYEQCGNLPGTPAFLEVTDFKKELCFIWPDD